MRHPAEWEPHAAVWVAWPHDDTLWEGALAAVQREWVDLCRAIADIGADGLPRGERLEVLVADDVSEANAAKALEGLGARFHRTRYGDVWLRDTAPIFVRVGDAVRPRCFGFNGWGGRYVFEGDAGVAATIAAAVGEETGRMRFVLEGGAIDSDGAGTVLTTRQCLLHPNRNPTFDQGAIEQKLGDALGTRAVLWLGDGLRNDHTDGHVDTLARFVAPGRVVCMEARTPDDPNRDRLDAVAEDLAGMRDATGRQLEVIRLPSPGFVSDADSGVPMPASYTNFYIANSTVVVPTYGVEQDDEAVEGLAALFPERRVVGRSARTLLTGGGAFHCVTQQQPMGATP